MSISSFMQTPGDLANETAVGEHAVPHEFGQMRGGSGVGHGLRVRGGIARLCDTMGAPQTSREVGSAGQWSLSTTTPWRIRVPLSLLAMRAICDKHNRKGIVLAEDSLICLRIAIEPPLTFRWKRARNGWRWSRMSTSTSEPMAASWRC